MLNKLTNGTLASLSLYFLTIIFYQLTPNLVILLPKPLTVLDFDQKIGHHSKTQELTVLEGDSLKLVWWCLVVLMDIG